jgi:transcriptional regulator with XRE-family HTH domain
MFGRAAIECIAEPVRLPVARSIGTSLMPLQYEAMFLPSELRLIGSYILDTVSNMKDSRPDVNQRIAGRVRQLRAAQGLSLDALARRTGVSRSMISVVERGESSPTAVVLDKLAVGLGVTLGALFDGQTSDLTPRSPVSRRNDQPEWKDPGSGYVRRNVSPLGKPQPIQIVEVRFPPGARVAFETSTRNKRVYQQIWLLEGRMDVSADKERHRLAQGDCLAMELDQPIIFHNPYRTAARYAVVIADDPHPKRTRL